MTSPSRAPAEKPQPTLVRGLSLLDSVLLLVGGIIGSGIFLTAGQIASEVRRPAIFLLVWLAGGVITLLACFAFGELGSMFPDAGGQYVFLREAYGELPAFLYGWMIFTVSVTGTVAALAVGFAEYLGAALAADFHAPLITVAGWSLTRGNLIALTAIAVLTTVNVLGLRRGAILQNVATWLKFAAIAAFVLLGLSIGKGSWTHLSGAMPVVNRSPITAIGVALIAVFWALDGWVYITWVAGEVKDPRRNLPRAMVLGVATVTVIYVAINFVYIYALPIERIAPETTIAQAAAVALFSPAAATWLSALIAVSCFGAMSVAILSGGRVYYAMARDGLFFRRMAEVHPRWRTPAFSLIAQGVWAGVLALSGRYDQLFTYVMFMMVLSYAATVVGLFVLRRKLPDAPRPYRCTGYPWLPLLYVIIGGLFALNAAVERPKEALAGGAIVLLGVPGYVYWTRTKLRAAPTSVTAVTAVPPGREEH